ncbi:hypothetical protein VN97_g2812 [Penicillium thymicola]|uniref:non-specific serine/threonine protein kinase n=1 Tax=Penicillium thymicola TaxID=293382 RepID=A0AAI9TPV2_PENTH|nr:hypothetical protein VN97_g2812 [Penicillium thymicola]
MVERQVKINLNTIINLLHAQYGYNHEMGHKGVSKASLPCHVFSTSGFETVRPSEVLDEERFEQFKRGQYYPANIGDVIISKYQIIGKLGFGTTSTVWLARDLKDHQYVTLKIYTRDQGNQEEFQIYKQLNLGRS